MDGIMLGYVLKVRPFARKNDVVRIEYINNYDVLIEFTDGEKCLYDTLTNYFRTYDYDSTTITEEQWKFEFREKLNTMMIRMDIDQGTLAKMVGVLQSTISKYVSGRIMPSPYMIHKLAMALGCRDEDLLYQDY